MSDTIPANDGILSMQRLRSGRRRSQHGAKTTSLFSPYFRCKLPFVTIIIFLSSIQLSVGRVFGGGIGCSGGGGGSRTSKCRWSLPTSNRRLMGVSVQEEEVPTSSTTAKRKRIFSKSNSNTSNAASTISSSTTTSSASATNIFPRLRRQESQQAAHPESESSPPYRGMNILRRRQREQREQPTSDIKESISRPKEMTSQKQKQKVDEVLSPSSSSSSSSETSLKTPFGRFHREEYDHAWTAIKNGCQGCWSGIMRVYKVTQTTTSRGGGNNDEQQPPSIKLKDPNAKDLNFRLRVHINKKEKK